MSGHPMTSAREGEAGGIFARLLFAERSGRSRCLGAALWGALLLSPLLGSGCASPPLEQRGWIEARTPNFVVKSRLSEKETQRLLEELELFRRVILRVTTAKGIDSHSPIPVYVFAEESELREVEPAQHVVGRFITSTAGNRIVMTRAPGMHTERILKHEYVHYVVRTTSRRPAPAWYGEGFAEFLSTVDVRDGMVRIGLVPADRVPSLLGYRMPVRDLLTPSKVDRWSPEKASGFYAWSWALVHYLHLGRESSSTAAGQISRYVDLLHAGVGSDAAFQTAYGLDVAQLEMELPRYVLQREFPIVGMPVERVQADVRITSKPVEAAEIAADLGGLLLLRERPESAKRYFERALVAAPELAEAHLGLGTVHTFEGKLDQAIFHYERALELAPANARAHLGFGKHWYARARKTDDPEDRAALLGKARERFTQSLALDAAAPDTLAMLGASFVLDGDDVDEGILWLEKARDLFPSDLGILVMLAAAYLEAGRPDSARDLAATVRMWSHPGSEESARAWKLLLAIMGYEHGLEPNLLDYM